MPSVKEDLARGHQVSEARGFTEITRVFRVENLTKQPQLQLLEAIDDSDIPEIGDTYPDTLGEFVKYKRCLVIAKEAFPSGCEAARVVVKYSNDPTGVYDQFIDQGQSTPTPDVKQVTSSLVQVPITRDAAGVEMIGIPAPTATSAKEKVITVNRGTPIATFVFERTETNIGAFLGWARDQVGTVNLSAIGPYLERTMRFDRLDCQSDDAGKTWRSVWQFSYNRSSWDYRYTYKDEKGRTTVGTVEQVFRIYPETDFATFGLNFLDTQDPI